MNTNATDSATTTSFSYVRKPTEPMWPAFGQMKPQNWLKHGASRRKPEGYVRDQNGSWRRKDLLGMN